MKLYNDNGVWTTQALISEAHQRKDDSGRWTVHLLPSVVEAANRAGIDVHEFYLKHYGAKVEIQQPVPKADG